MKQYHMTHTLQPDENGQLQWIYLRDQFREGLKAAYERYLERVAAMQ